jgi:tetratricopeptide (TPR) repeat protein
MIMKNITFLITSCFLLVFFYSCSEKSVTNVADYVQFMQPGKKDSTLLQIESDRQFWQNRIDSNAGEITARTKLAGLLARRFSRTGNIADLHASDSFYILVNAYYRTTTSSIFRALAANCVTQHRFRQAQSYIDSALALGDDKYLTTLQEFDVAMELGNYQRAQKALNSLVDKKGFDFLIRESKYADMVSGDLDAAIDLMEKAYTTLPANPSPALYVWVKSNLGDMYGHANRYADSYNSYLEALAKDPHDYHALKGIAWLAFSHDRDLANAKKILNYLKQQHPIPDYDLMLAEIAGYEKDTAAEKMHRDKFIAATQNSMYGDMYNKYHFNLQADELNNSDSAFAIARQEVKNRPSPEAFGWLAWAYCKKGDLSNALQTSGWYVENKCHEPEILYYVGMIYQKNGNKTMAKKYLKEASLSSYELGPATADQIQEILANL